MKKRLACGVFLWCMLPWSASANLTPAQFTITPTMTNEQKIVILRAHVEYLQQKLIALQAQASSSNYVVTVKYPEAMMEIRRANSDAVLLTVDGVATTSVARAIARFAGERESAVVTKTTFVYEGAETIVTYRVVVRSPYRITLERVQANGVVKREVVPRATIDGLIASSFFGNTRIYEQVLGSYVTDIRRNRVAPEIRQIAATLFAVPETTLVDTLEFDVTGYKR